MKTLAELRDELEEAREEIRWLRDAMTPPKDFQFPWRPRTKLTRYNQVILYTLAKSRVPLTEKELLVRVEMVMQREIAHRQIAHTIHRMRKRLKEEGSSIVIQSRRGTRYGHGYWLDDASKAIVLGTDPK